MDIIIKLPGIAKTKYIFYNQGSIYAILQKTKFFLSQSATVTQAEHQWIFQEKGLINARFLIIDGQTKQLIGQSKSSFFNFHKTLELNNHQYHLVNRNLPKGHYQWTNQEGLSLINYDFSDISTHFDNQSSDKHNTATSQINPPYGTDKNILLTFGVYIIMMELSLQNITPSL